MDMRRYFIFIMACLLCLGLVSCMPDNKATDFAEEEEQEAPKPRFERVYLQTGKVNTKIYVDTYTGVMYMFVETGYGNGGLTVMLDKYGNPMIWGGVEADEH